MSNIFAFINRNASINEFIPIINDASLNSIDDNGLNPIMLAISKSMEDLSLKFLDYNIKLDISDNLGFTPLIYACKYKLTNVAIKIIDKFINSKQDILINHIINGDNALSFAIKNKLENVVLKFLSLDKETINLDFVDSDGNTLLMIAINNSLPSIAIKLLDFPNIINNINIKNKNGQTAKDISIERSLNDVTNVINTFNTDLFTLIDNSSIPEFKQSIALLPNLLTKTNNLNQTPLIYSLIKRRIDIVLIIIEHAKTNGPDSVKLSHIDDFGLTPLMYSCIITDFTQISLSILDIAKDKGTNTVNLSFKNTNNDTALIWAIEKKLSDVAMKILEFNPDDILLNLIKNEQTILMIAAKNGLDNVTLRILQIDTIDTSVFDNYGNTVLHYACLSNLTNVALELLNKSADDISLEQVSKTGFTSLMIACENKMEDVAIKILDFKPLENDLYHVNFKGETALMIACLKRMENTVNKMLTINPRMDLLNAQQVNKYGNTALMIACSTGLSVIAIKLLELGHDKVNLQQVNVNNQNAYDIAKSKNLTDVVTYIDILTSGIFALLDNNVSIDIIEKYIISKPESLRTVNNLQQPFVCAALWNKKPDIVTRIFDLVKNDKIDINYLGLDYGDDRGLTPLMMACIFKYDNIALDIIEFGKDNNLLSMIGNFNTSNNTALHISTGKSNEIVSNKIIEVADELDKRFIFKTINDQGFTPLINACKNNLSSVALNILNSSIPIEDISLSHTLDNGDTAFIFALRNKMTDVIKKMMSIAKPFELKLNAVGSDGNTPLQIAIINSMEDIVFELIKNDIQDLNITNKNKMNKNAVLLAQENNLIKVSEELVNLINNDIFLAISAGRSIEDIQHLIDSDNDVLQSTNNNNQTPFNYACSISNLDVANFIFGFGNEANLVNKPDDLNNNALLYSCKNKLSDIAIKIINNDISYNSVSIINKYGFTPLIYSIKNNMNDIATVLLKLDASNINLSQVAYNNNALIEALISENQLIISEILKFKPYEYNISQIIKDYNRIIDNSGSTILDKVRLTSNVEFINMVELLIGKDLLIASDDSTPISINKDTNVIEPLNLYNDILDYNDGMVNAQQYLDAVVGSIIVEYNNFLYGTNIDSFGSQSLLYYPCKTINENYSNDNLFKNILLFNFSRATSININGMVSFNSIKNIIEKSDNSNRYFKLINTHKRYISPISINFIKSKNTNKNEPHCNIDGGYIYELIPISTQSGGRRRNKKIIYDIADLSNKKNNYFNISNSSKKLLKTKYMEDDISDALLDYFKQMNIPFPQSNNYLDDSKKYDMFNKLQNYSGKWSYSPYTILPTEELDYPLSLKYPKSNSDYKLHMTYIPDNKSFYDIDNLVNLFTEKARLLSKKNVSSDIDSPINKWYKYDDLVHNAIKYNMNNNNDIDAYNLREGIYNSMDKCPYVECMNERSTFYYMLLNELLNIINNESLPYNVLDVCSGWGDRLIASLASKCNKYIGIDPNTNLKDGYKNIIDTFGDSNNHIFINDSMPEASLPNELYNNSMSIAFFSPPPFNNEIYSNDNNQSINLYPTLDSWFINFIFPTLDITWLKINYGGVLVVDSIFAKEINSYIKYLLPGSEFIGTISVKTNVRNKPLWIWKKTNKRTRKNKKELEKVFSEQVIKYLDNL